MASRKGVQMKSKREIEKELWPFVKPNIDLSTSVGRAGYMQFQRDFQKKLSEQLKHNPITVYDLLFKVDVMAVDVAKLLRMDMALKKKRDER
jgi:hypothetical protein